MECRHDNTSLTVDMETQTHDSLGKQNKKRDILEQLRKTKARHNYTLNIEDAHMETIYINLIKFLA